LLRYTLAGLIPLMMSEKYSVLIEEFYQEQKSDFDKIMKTKSYFLVRDLPVKIASRILLPEVPKILSMQKSNGLWNNSTRVTYDILSALKHIQILDDLIVRKKLKNVAEQLANKYDYYSLLIKLIIYQQCDKNDFIEIKKLTQDIKSMQNENGSWEDTIVATVYYIEKLVNLGTSYADCSVQKGITFLFEHLNLNWEALQSSGKAYGLESHYVFSTENRDLEFEAAQKYKEELKPRLICYRHLGVMQNSLCLKLLIQMNFEHDERVISALNNIFSVFKNYHSLCYFNIQKKVKPKNARGH